MCISTAVMISKGSLLALLLVGIIVGFAQGQDYIFAGPANTQYIPYQQTHNQYINPSEIIPFRQIPAGFQPVDPSSAYLPRQLHAQDLQQDLPRDLQTSDLPLHLQQTLPQYRYTTNQPQFQEPKPDHLQYPYHRNSPSNRIVNSPVGFRPVHNHHSQKPTTVRPNYSHLFSRTHNHDPSQTETFLGQITLQNPIESPPHFDEFRPSPEFPEKAEEITSNSFAGAREEDGGRVDENHIQSGSRPSFLNQRTRIFAPDKKATTRSQIKNYFVNSNGDVYLTTKTPFSPKPTTPFQPETTVERKNHFSPTPKPTGKPLAYNVRAAKKVFLPKNPAGTTALPPPRSVDLGPLLEEPIKEDVGRNNYDDVEVIQFHKDTTDAVPITHESETVRPSQETTTPNITRVSHSTTRQNDEEVTTVYDDDIEDDPRGPTEYSYSEELYDSRENGSYEHVGNENDIRDDENSEHEGETFVGKEKKFEELNEAPKDEDETQKLNSTYEVITMKPTTMVKDSNFHDFVDTVAIDTTEAPAAIETTTLPMSSSVNFKNGEGKDIEKPDEEEEPEVVISVVTSKTVVNNTVIASATPMPHVTEASNFKHLTTESSIMTGDDNTTDAWVVVASVQTSRSVSGARYLPSSIVEQDERVKLLNEPSSEETSREDYSNSREGSSEDAEGEEEGANDEETTTEEAEKDTTIQPTSAKPKTSTESLIDKLDRVQSDLSSGLLTGGLGNNIAVIKETAPDKMDAVTTMIDMGTTTSTTAKVPYPQVNIRKFSPGNRPRPTKRPRTNLGSHRLRPGEVPATAPSAVDINQPQSDQPLNKVVVKEDISSLLPPGYKVKGSDDKSSKLLAEILSKIKPDTKDMKTEGEVIEENTENSLKITTLDDISKFLPPGYKLPKDDDKTTEASIFKTTKLDDIAKFLPPGYKLPKAEEHSSTETPKVDISKFLPPGYKNPKNEDKTTEANIFKNTKLDDISKFLPPGYKLPKAEEKTTEASIFKTSKIDDISKFLPPGFKLPKSEEKATESSILKHTKLDDISKFLPPGYKLPKSEQGTTEASVPKTSQIDISKFLPPGFKLPKSEEKTTEASMFRTSKVDDISKFLPPGFKVPKAEEKTTESSIFKNTRAEDVSKFLPPGYKLNRYSTRKPKGPEPEPMKGDSEKGLHIKPVDVIAFLPPGYKPKEPKIEASQDLPPNLLPAGFGSNGTTDTAAASSTAKPAAAPAAGGFKVVFPSRPGGGHRKSASRTTSKSGSEESGRPTVPTIHKGWPSRATTEFTGWPTPSTTPISIEKLLEAARNAYSTTSHSVETESTPSTTTTTTTTTTTPKPTTPGICELECDLAGTIKLVDGVKWQKELLDRNTKEWQLLANEVQAQLDDVYSSSGVLNKWYRKIRIDGFSEGSVLVDYLVELNDLGRRIDTTEMKKLFHESLDDASSKYPSNREGKSLNETIKLDGKLAMGSFIVDPKYTDFVVLPKEMYPTVGYAENDVLLPQWAIAVIVIGLASLLFVIIFGVTVLVNRQKNAKKKSPTPLTEDMLNELNKNHMGGFDNYGADDLYNMEDVWNDRGYDQKPPKKRSNGSIHDNSMSNLYDSWRSEWNGYYYNAYYGNNPGSSHSGYNGRRRSDYDTNF